ncbi:MAG: protein kinase [Candidatus Nealsonbacteria bacterium]|nr:protein kinase [Candidatus Nealsonbacteria bacterium]
MAGEKLVEMKAYCQKAMSCKNPEQLFGELTGDTSKERLDKLKKEYVRLLYLYHPEANKGESEELQSVAGKITNVVIYLYSLAEKRIMLGTYGSPDPASSEGTLYEMIKTRSHEYAISRLLAQENDSRVYAARMDGAADENVCLKIAKEPAANKRLLAESEVLENVRHYQLPKLVDAFMTGDGLMVLVQELIDGFDLFSILAMPRYQNGIPQEHVAWIADRGLNIIGKVHTLGRLHGNITPSHLMVRSRDHSVFLIGFTESVKKVGGRYGFKADIYGAPEITKDAPLMTQSDLYAFGKCLILALGGDPVTNRLPESVNPKIVDFLAGLVCVDPNLREGDAWGAWHRWSDLRLELFGERRSFKYFAVD